MILPLWSFDELVTATHAGKADGRPTRDITGMCIDTRALEPGDAFIALKDQRDGHDFVTSAFKAGASVAIVSEHYVRKPGDGALIRVPDTLAALENVGISRRAQVAPSAKVIAVTGSAGKTGTKEMLRACLSKVAPGHVHASEKSYNNHWGVPLTLARMPRDTKFAVFEIGMNHAGEITPLTKMVLPHVAIVTTVEAVHLEHFGTVAAIADAKAEIFLGLTDGTAIIKRSGPFFEQLKARAMESIDNKVVSFGLDAGADVYAESMTFGDDGSDLVANVGGERAAFRISMPGRHIAENSLAVAAAIAAVGAPLDRALAALGEIAPPPGRGARHQLTADGGPLLLIDESYNANPASMRAALGILGAVPRATFHRRIAVLGDMLELGKEGPALHRDLFEAVDGAGADLLFACGPLMKGLYDAAPAAMKGAWAETAAELTPIVLRWLAAGDVVMVKASNGTRLSTLVEAIKQRFKGASSNRA
jgi:UDP-N-acetylmuramoyl-tripeptide--D-alanyl-D-alanine ligase